MSPPTQGTHFAQEDELHKTGIALAQLSGGVAAGATGLSQMAFNYRAVLGIEPIGKNY